MIFNINNDETEKEDLTQEKSDSDQESENINPEAGQRCNVLCLAKHKSPEFDDVSKCIADKKCHGEPVSECPLPEVGVPLADIDFEDLTGDWYVVRGLSRAYDCWSCQKMSFKKIEEKKYEYEYESSVIPPETSVHKCEITPSDKPPVKPGHIKVEYEAHGLTGFDDWYLLSWPHPDYILIYYCGYTPIASYRGGVVMSRKPSTDVPSDILTAFDEALDNSGISTPVEMEDFCFPDNSSCK